LRHGFWGMDAPDSTDCTCHCVVSFELRKCFTCSTWVGLSHSLHTPMFVLNCLQTRVVHFIGAMKPWHYEYDAVTCELKATGTVSPHLLQLWWDIFLTFINPRLTRYIPGLVGQLALLQVLYSASTLLRTTLDYLTLPQEAQLSQRQSIRYDRCLQMF